MTHKYTKDYLENVSFEKDPYKLGINSTLEELKNAFYDSDNDIKALAIYIGCEYNHPEILDLVEEKEIINIKLLAIEEAYILGNTKILDKFLHSKDKNVRLFLAKLGYKLNELKEDKDNEVLKQVLKSAFNNKNEDIIKYISANGVFYIQIFAEQYLERLKIIKRRAKILFINYIVAFTSIFFILNIYLHVIPLSYEIEVFSAGVSLILFLASASIILSPFDFSD